MSNDLDLAQHLFERAPFLQHLGVRVTEACKDQVISELELQPWMTQATGVAHAGIVTAIADHTAAAAARIHSGNPQTFVSIEVHTSLVRPAAGPILRTIGKTTRAGKRISFASAEVYSVNGDKTSLCATFSVSLITAPPAPTDA